MGEMLGTTVGSPMSPWSAIGQKCYICYSNYETGVSHHSSDYRQQVMESCADTLFSEITGDEFDWNLIICNENLPFCQNCWQSIEKIFELNQHKETTENSIENIVKDLATKILSNRKYLKKKGVLSTSKTNPLPANFGSGIKIEGFSVNQNIKCKMCHNVFEVAETNNLISMDISEKVMECCELHLFPELIDEDFFDWNSTPFINFVPFCEECSQDVKSITELADKLKDIESFISNNVDMFTLNVLKCRKSLKKRDRHGYRRKREYRDDSSCADSIDSQDTIDWDDDCQIINVAATNVYPTSFAQTSMQESPRQFTHSSSPGTSKAYREGIQIEETVPMVRPVPESSTNSRLSYSFDGDLTRPNSAETCVVQPSPQQSSSFSIIGRPNVGGVGNVVKRNPPEMSAALKMSINENNDNNIVTTNEQLENGSVAIARLPLLTGLTGGTLFRCQNCWKIFIYRKCWEAHALECPKPTAESSEPSTDVVADVVPEMRNCCGQTFSDEESWDMHRVSHRSRSFMRQSTNPAQKNVHSKTSPLSPAPARSRRRERRSQSEEYHPSIPVEYQCNLCEKSCQTKRGLNLHVRSHTVRPYKCSQCPSAFGYPSQLMKHHRIEHPDNYNSNKFVSPPKLKSSRSESHLPMISKKRRLNFTCRFCPIPIYAKTELIEHVQTHYDIAEGLRCEICITVFSSKSSLKSHNGSFHKQLS